MTTYKVYYRDEFGVNFCFVEVADIVGGKKRSPQERTKAARKAAIEEQHVEETSIIKIVKDC